MDNALAEVSLGRRLSSQAGVSLPERARLAEADTSITAEAISRQHQQDEIAFLAKQALADPSGLANYPSGLVFDLALETLPPADVLAVYKIDIEAFKGIAQNPNFIAEYRALREQLKTEGFSFRLKARAQAESLLATSWQLIHAPSTPPSVKKDLIIQTVRWANLEPKEQEQDRGAVSVVINLGDNSAPVTIQGGMAPALT